MFYFLSLFSGILISLMVVSNGGLSEQYGLHSATVLVHFSGLILITLLVLQKKERPFAKIQRLYLYLGGALGVFITVFPNFAFGRISVSAILALLLLGQTVAGLIVDQIGFLDMPTHPFTKKKIIGLLLILGGIIYMINDFEIVAIVLTFISGILIVIARTLNARLAV